MNVLFASSDKETIDHLNIMPTVWLLLLLRYGTMFSAGLVAHG